MSKYNALGLIETFGIVFVLEAADAMCKAWIVNDYCCFRYERFQKNSKKIILSSDYPIGEMVKN